MKNLQLNPLHPRQNFGKSSATKMVRKIMLSDAEAFKSAREVRRPEYWRINSVGMVFVRDRDLRLSVVGDGRPPRIC
jgi:hypothetical protein